MTPRAVDPVGVLLVNLGTPEAPTTQAVRTYLREFLSDERVIDIPSAARWLLLEAVILPRRPAQSAAAYRKVWTAEGSPLLVHGRALATGVQRELGPAFRVELAMRYRQPSIESAVEALLRAGASRLVAMPLYPHATSSSTGSSIEELFRVLSKRWDVPPISIVPDFHADEGFLGASQEVAAAALDGFGADHLLFSFHGLPERHIRKSDVRAHGCLDRASCCDVAVATNRGCYRAQCHATARALAQRLALAHGAWSVAFQSRLGRTPWIRPYTDLRVRELAQSGTRRLAVIDAGFVADCLETLEEIGIRAREDFRAHGGEDLRLVPCLNAHPTWVRAAANLVRRAAGAG
jgi:ferrochelatase